ncbi:MAG: serpin family protein [Bacteroidota bacterium]
MNLKALAAASIIIVSLTSCAPQPPFVPDDFEEVNLASNELGFRMMENLDEEQEEDNIFISPLSISTALSMAANGAEGSTQRQMFEAMGYSQLSETEANAQYKTLLEVLDKTDQEAVLKLANAIYYREGFPAEADFLQQTTDNYNGEIEEIDFSDPAAKNTINQWVEDETEERIKDIVSEIKDTDMMFLINTIYFTGPWTNGFDERSTSIQKFDTGTGSEVDVEMMFQDATFAYYDGGNFEMASFPIGKDEGRFSLDVFLPKEIKRYTEILSFLSAENYSNVIDSLSDPTRLMVTFPKMEIEYEKNLNETLKDMGMTLAFSPREADFSGIADVPDLHISRVKHKTFLKIDEDGVEAAGATSVGIAITSAPPEFRIDHPFIMVIRDIQTGTVLFMGKIMNPNN